MEAPPHNLQDLKDLLQRGSGGVHVQSCQVRAEPDLLREGHVQN